MLSKSRGFDFNSCGEGKRFSSRNEQIWTCSDYSLMCQFICKSRHLETVLQTCRYLTSVKSLTGPSATFNVHLKKSGALPPPSVMSEYFWITWNSHPLEMLTWEYTFLDTCFIIFQLYTKISILEVWRQNISSCRREFIFSLTLPRQHRLE